MSNAVKLSSRFVVAYPRHCSVIMRIATCLLVALLFEAISGGNGGSQHIHFRIHVPEVIERHVHTRTIFVHVPKKKRVPKPRKNDKPSVNHKEEHHENWSTWSYDHHEDHGGADKSKVHSQDYRNVPVFDYDKDSYFPRPVSSREETNQNANDENGLVGYSYPPQYATHEAVEEFPRNHVGSYRESFEEGYRKGLQREEGHVHTDERSKYQDDKYEENDNSLDEYDDKEERVTNAGRYFVEEEVAEKDNRRKRRRDRRILPKIHVT